MVRKTVNIVFITIFALMLTLPFIFANRKSGQISEQENRVLKGGAALVKDGAFNMDYPSEYEDWFKDNLGFRGRLLNYYGKQLYYVFKQFPDSDETKLGKNRDLNYAPDFIIADYQHINLWSPEQVDYIAQCYQKVSDWVESNGAEFYYVQCVDKHTICPEQFLGGLNRLGDISKTDQVMEALDTQTSVKHLYLKSTMQENKEKYQVYGHWNDSTHWTPRGAFLGYRATMDMINSNRSEPFKVLDEADYNIEVKDQGASPYGIHKEDMLEAFEIKAPKGVEQEDKSAMQVFADDDRHKIWINTEIQNGKKLLVMGDSYFGSANEAFAESFSEEWLIWGDYIQYLKEAVQLYQPDIVILQAAERVDRSYNIVKLAESF